MAFRRPSIAPDPLEQQHRLELRRQRALHAVQRRELDAAPARRAERELPAARNWERRLAIHDAFMVSAGGRGRAWAPLTEEQVDALEDERAERALPLLRRRRRRRGRRGRATAVGRGAHAARRVADA